MRDFCRGHQESGYDSGFAFGFRADTAQYAYLIRLHPYKGEENLFLYCYRRDWLDRHMEQAEKASGSSTRTTRNCSASRTVDRSVFSGKAARPSTGPAAILMTAMWR